jgi:hypothetical protein
MTRRNDMSVCVARGDARTASPPRDATDFSANAVQVKKPAAAPMPEPHGETTMSAAPKPRTALRRINRDTAH